MVEIRKLKRILGFLFSGATDDKTYRQAERQMQIFSEVTRAIASSLSGETNAYQLITEAVTSLFHVERCILFIPMQGRLQAAAASGIVQIDTLASLNAEINVGTISEVYRTGNAVSIADAKKVHNENPILSKLNVQSMIAAPLKTQSKTIGVITADTPRDKRAFRPEDVRLLEVFGTFAALVASESERIKQLREKSQEVELLVSLTRQLNSEETPGAVLQHVVHSAIEHTKSTSGSVVFIDPERHALIIRASEGLPESAASQLTLELGEGITGWVAREGKSALVNNVNEDDRYVAVNTDIQSEIAVPIRVGGEVIGVLNVDHSEPEAYGEHHQGFLEALADLAAARIRSAMTDAGTQESKV